MEYRIGLVTFLPRLCSLRPNFEQLITEWIAGAHHAKPKWVNLLYGRIKGYVCLGSDYRRGVGHISTPNSTKHEYNLKVKKYI